MDAQIGNVHGVAAVHVGDADTRSNFNGATAMDNGFLDTDMNSVAAMKARLTAIDANAYSATNLAHMTYNDLVYALRVHDAPSTVK